MTSSLPDSLTRRRAVFGATAAVVASLAGCGGSDDAPEPITIGETDRCDVCGMVIRNHPGPIAQIFYADNEPADHGNPARFCSAWEAFQYDFNRQNEGWTRRAFYTTDYSGVDYEITTDGGDRFISAHPSAEAFAAGESVTFDAGSSVLGAMGADLIGFADESDARAFADEYGGEVVGFADVTPSVISELGMS
jgi:nitrous oxide reductase accessory protein NosL